jgi:hypothetical protein
MNFESNGTPYAFGNGKGDPAAGDDDRNDEAADRGEELDPRAEIARLEAQIERLSERLEWCRKVRLFSHVAMVLGAIWLAAALVGLIAFDPIALIAAISAIIGGIVAFGSNTTTTKEVAVALKRAEARRFDLIASLELRVVGDRERAIDSKYH